MASPAINDTGFITLVAGETLPAHARVTINASGEAILADATDKGIGHVDQRGGVSGDPCTIRTWQFAEHIGIANAALETGDPLFAAADGEVDDVDAGTAVVVGVATSAATAAGQLVTYLLYD